MGIRQGCPLSPLLFAVVIDLFLRQIRRLNLPTTLRAYADDIAIVTRSIRDTAPMLQTQFAELAKISNLALNIPKTVCIPLWRTNLDRTRQTITTVCPQWNEIQVSDTGKYLGFYVGPGKGELSWQAAGDKC